MEEIKDTAQRHIELLSLAIWALLCIAGLAYSTKFAMGVAIGGLICVLNYRFMAWHAKKAVTLPPQKGHSYMVSRFILRLSITGLVILGVLVWVHVSVVGLLLGLSVVMLSIVSYTFYTYIFAGGD